ncbi:YrbL family protein [Vreelandella rituensis]|nr:YrbL family protein [Halomonas rituensis]
MNDFYLNNKLELNEDSLFSSGSERDCYLYKFKGKSFCVKISHGRDRNKKQNEKEADYYDYLARNRKSFFHMPKCYGWVETNKGTGLVFDFVMDSNGNPAKNLEDYVLDKGVDESLESGLSTLKNYLIKNNIIVCDLKEKNVLYQCGGNDEVFLWIVDGIGDRGFLKLSSDFKIIGRKKIKRHWKRFVIRLERLKKS